ncbi:sigma-54-dependent transcriptional regulator [Desulfoluna butyratoxydans]|uniref:Signal transduction response regulator receiver domain n=1 Tax=Desulfoluna butyratoxydans TaxID=231438 RepID=A0A4U8YMT1_9BACT|nr:sigma-54 dependent transcriptional regulator [Desulfoluna butyratoxydans]VFQ45080.1 signal transduction response regulator receiver domain [Desulfoluna butyratoxydans]
MSNVLIIDDDQQMCTMLCDLVHHMDHEAAYAQTLAEGLRLALSGGFDVVFLDVRMPDGNGLEAMKEILEIDFPPEIIVMTGMGDSDGAERAIRNGAWDYIQKPLSPKKIIQPLDRVLQYRDNIRTAARPARTLKRAGIVGNSHQVQECLDTVAKASQSLSNVLITGETGTGKELFARAIHANSGRSRHRFVVVDCAALPETLVESALFGHEKGSFTGADKAAEGLVGLANGGTLFLDEVGEMNLNLQKAFLRVLQERRYRPVGSKKEVESDFRLVAATNRKLSDMVRQGLFREDLLYRLNAVSLTLPPLRERLEDLPGLVKQLSAKVYGALGIKPKGVSQDFIAALGSYHWPGNVRELVNTLESSISDAYYEPELFSKHLPEQIRITMARSSVAETFGDPGEEKEVVSVAAPADLPSEPKPAADAEVVSDLPLPTYKAYRESVLNKAEKTYLQELMKVTRGSIKDACAISGLGRTRLYTLLKKHSVDRMGWGVNA